MQHFSFRLNVIREIFLEARKNDSYDLLRKDTQDLPFSEEFTYDSKYPEPIAGSSQLYYHDWSGPESQDSSLTAVCSVRSRPRVCSGMHYAPPTAGVQWRRRLQC